jgi:hypothetical protein
MEFNKLPENIQQEIKEILRAFDDVNVVFENGRYNVSVGIALTNFYDKDRKFIGTYKAVDIYTEEERIVNYIEEFLDYPIFYKGNRDWKIINQLEELKQQDKTTINKIKIVDGNAVLI